MHDPTKGIVALIPHDAVGYEHLTLCYASHIDTNQALRWMVQNLARNTAPIAGHVLDHATFGGLGEDPPIQVARIAAPELYGLFYSVETWHESEYPFNPHVSEVDSKVRPLNSLVLFNRIGLWNDDIGLHENYRLGSGTRCA